MEFERLNPMTRQTASKAQAMTAADAGSIAERAAHGFASWSTQGPNARRAVLIGGVFAWALPGSLGYIRFLWREHTPVLNLPLDVVYSCFGVFLVAVILRAAMSAARLVGARWREEI